MVNVRDEQQLRTKRVHQLAGRRKKVMRRWKFLLESAAIGAPTPTCSRTPPAALF